MDEEQRRTQAPTGIVVPVDVEMEPRCVFDVVDPIHPGGNSIGVGGQHPPPLDMSESTRVDAGFLEGGGHDVFGAARPPLDNYVAQPGDDGEHETDTAGETIEGARRDEQRGHRSMDEDS